jgi:hypothetical protein
MVDKQCFWCKYAFNSDDEMSYCELLNKYVNNVDSCDKYSKIGSVDDEYSIGGNKK